MNVSLTPRLEAMIHAKVESGLYNNASEVVREALRIMEREEQLQRLREEIQIGIDQIERGETVEWTDDFMTRLIWEAENNSSIGNPVRDSIKP